jgi:hypothetical protein
VRISSNYAGLLVQPLPTAFSHQMIARFLLLRSHKSVSPVPFSPSNHAQRIQAPRFYAREYLLRNEFCSIGWNREVTPKSVPPQIQELRKKYYRSERISRKSLEYCEKQMDEVQEQLDYWKKVVAKHEDLGLKVRRPSRRARGFWLLAGIGFDQTCDHSHGCSLAGSIRTQKTK